MRAFWLRVEIIFIKDFINVVCQSCSAVSTCLVLSLWATMGWRIHGRAKAFNTHPFEAEYEYLKVDSTAKKKTARTSSRACSRILQAKSRK
ncbi:MAG: hypothetical protein COW32_07520 [Candidatus Aquicultor secundus]|nr:MAG: hypothetical protein COW32_07520 [Candidatus Aquicultor secundus]PIX51993.1 MAG: hypothetical protein COZ51_06520 [Candidatus Aquicultor secundus]